MSEPMRFRKKPIEVEAMLWQPAMADRDVQRVFDWLNANIPGDWHDVDGRAIEIYTPEGWMRADPGDWIIKGVKGEFYPCNPEAFFATYEPAEETSST